jgi:hypothetical protein
MSEIPEQPHEGALNLQQTAKAAVPIEVLYESETFWLNQKRIADLFGVDLRTVSYHLKEIYDSSELTPEATLRTIWRVQTEGNRDVRREIEFYNYAIRPPAKPSGRQPFLAEPSQKPWPS